VRCSSVVSLKMTNLLSFCRYDLNIYISATLPRDGADEGAAKEEATNSSDEQGITEDDMLEAMETISDSTDCIGLEAAKSRLYEALLLPSAFPHLFTGVRQPAKSILLHGPPGTGKTLLAQNCATACGFKFLTCQPANLLSKWTGGLEKQMAMSFKCARQNSPAVLFFDEFDSIGSSRGKLENDPAARRLLTTWLVQMNEMKRMDNIVVIAATNRPEDLDPAVLRRFDVVLMSF
jgi:SpoVK/Ycf46/Vps4 family AAA+-type ATPase